MEEQLNQAQEVMVDILMITLLGAGYLNPDLTEEQANRFKSSLLHFANYSVIVADEVRKGENDA